MEVKISVRNLIEFILRSGNIDNRIGTFREDAMLEGGRIHRMIQKRAGADYTAEVPLSWTYEYGNLNIIVEGRADGIIDSPSMVTVDEIKSTYADVMRFREAQPIHMAQAMFYAYMIAERDTLPVVNVRITYCNIETEEIKYFNKEFSYEELRDFTTDVCDKYEKWARFTIEHTAERNESIEGLSFPFAYRKGQEELVKQVYITITRQKKLFLEAPTGVGKTISTMFPGVWSLGRGMVSKIFYLTAKTITRTVASETLDIMRGNGLSIKSVVLTAKEKICMTGDAECNPDVCPYANGHYDRVNDALYDLITNEDGLTRETILEYAEKHKVCPFELSLDCSLFTDVVIGDYNYAFDPRAKLKRFFADEKSGEYLFLIDEAHNLVDRAREMYSAEIIKEDLMALKRLTQVEIPVISKRAEACNKDLLSLKRMCETSLIDPPVDGFVMDLTRLYAAIEKIIQDKNKPDTKSQEKTKSGEPKLIVSPELKKQLLEYYFELSHFLSIYELVDENYTTYCSYTDSGDFYLRLFNINPKKNLGECMEKARSTILFSATLLPIWYYKELLSGQSDDYEVYAESIFDPSKRGLFIGNDVTSKYTRRSTDEFRNIARYIYEITSSHPGNYMVFFPSYGFLQSVREPFDNEFKPLLNAECLYQYSGMTEEEREIFLKKFKGVNIDYEGIIDFEIDEESDSADTLIGFCVMGGVFSEGIDLKEDSLIGAIIVGTGLPMVCLENELIKNYFDETSGDGFDFAYRYPGMNKVLQAAGRVIRTENDVGIVALLDERFLQSSYRKMYPREWKEVSSATVNDIGVKIEDFWEQQNR